MKLVDSHAHLAMLDHDTEEQILKRARDEGVEKLITVSVDEASWEKNRRVAESNANVYYSLGLHPHDALAWAGCASKLETSFTNSQVPVKCVGIGECGLDYYYDNSPRETQLEALEGQLTLAKRVGLPLIFHCRDAYADLFATIRKVGLHARGGVMHCFTGSTEDAKGALDLGLSISFSGILTFKNAEALRQTAKTVPLERTLVETDCPFLSPMPMRGKKNEPSYLPWTVKVLAECHQLASESVAEATYGNTCSLFQI